MELKLEVIVLPVSDVDRAKDFYQRLDFRLDADFVVDEGYRVVQLTPPGSPASIMIGTGITTATRRVGTGPALVVSDIEVTRADITARGVDVSEVFHEADAFVHAGTEAPHRRRPPRASQLRNLRNLQRP